MLKKLQNILSKTLYCIAIFISSTDAKKPNVLVIFADDVGTGDVPGYWNSNKVDMPNLEQLVAEGTTFTDAYSTPLCAPSRYMFLSGNYPHRGKVPGSVWEFNYKDGSQFYIDQQKSLAQLLHENSYDTAVFGKWHVGGKVPTVDNFNPTTSWLDKKTMLLNPDHDWSKPIEQGPGDIGFKTSYITIGGLQSPPYVFFRDDMLDVSLDQVKYWDNGSYSMPNGFSIIRSPGQGFEEWDSTSYNMILVNETKAFLDKHINNAGDPFFAYVPIGNAHKPHSPPDKFLDGTNVAGSYGTRHMDILYEMDKVVGALIEALTDRQLLDDTIIIFTSDNGGLRGENTNSDKFGHLSSGQLRGAKDQVYEGGIRVPLTFRWDNGPIPKGEKRSQMIGLNDLYKTICGLIGIDVPVDQALDSINFANYIMDKNLNSGLREWQHSWRYNKNGVREEAIRYNDMKLIQHYNSKTVELYNLTADVSETNNIFKENIELVQLMQQKLTGPPLSVFCSDSPKRFTLKMNNIRIRIKCSHVAANPDYYCARSDIAATCPSTCNTCNICKDSPLRFHLKKTKFKNKCKKVKVQPEQMCAKEAVALTCRKTCGACV